MKLQRNLLGIYVLLLSVCVYAQQDLLTTANKTIQTCLIHKP